MTSSDHSELKSVLFRANAQAGAARVLAQAAGAADVAEEMEIAQRACLRGLEKLDARRHQVPSVPASGQVDVRYTLPPPPRLPFQKCA